MESYANTCVTFVAMDEINDTRYRNADCVTHSAWSIGVLGRSHLVRWPICPAARQLRQAQL